VCYGKLKNNKSVYKHTISVFVFQLCNKMSDRSNLRGGKISFGLVSEVSVYAWLAPLLWACGKEEHYGSQEIVAEEAVHLMVSRKQRERERERERERGRERETQRDL
jgi:hypothetical protein